MNVDKAVDLINKESAVFVDLRFTDTIGRFNHVTVPASVIVQDPDSWFEDGHMFDGSSFAGWAGVQASDMVLKADPDTAVVDPFYDEKTVAMICSVTDPVSGQGYEMDPRSIAAKAENYLVSTGLGDKAFFGPEPEFFVFDGMEVETGINRGRYVIHSEEGSWSSGIGYEGANSGHRPMLKGGYTPLAPVDSGQDLRSACCRLLECAGIPVEVHHHEVGTGGQMEIGTRFATLVTRADWTMMEKYIVFNTAASFGKTATFMPKPLVGDNGSGMHVHQSIWKGDANMFSGDGYAGLSDMALHYIGGVIKHARALNAITNPTTNSYKRLVPHYEAPVKLAYSARNRSASIRIPYSTSSKGRRIECRFPDPMANPYLAFSALMMAGLDGIVNKINPGDPIDKNLYDLPPEEEKSVPTNCASLEEALANLGADHDFLLRGGVFTENWVRCYIDVKMREVNRLRETPHPAEFEMYFSL